MQCEILQLSALDVRSACKMSRSGERNSSRGIFNEMDQSVRLAILCEQEGATSEVVVRVDVYIVIWKGCCEVTSSVELIIK